LRKTLEIVELGLLMALIAGGLSSCSSSTKAGIILNVSTAPNVDRSAITSLQVTVNGRTQSYDLGTIATWRLGIETSAGSKSIVVTGMAAAPVTDPWQGIVNAVEGQVVYQDVELQSVGTPALDGGSGGSPRADGSASDVPNGNGGSLGSDVPVASGGVGGKAGTGGASGFGGMTGLGGLPGTGAAQGTGGLPGIGGTPGIGGLPGNGGAARTGGVPGTGGITIGVGGTPGSGGRQNTGGVIGTAGTIGAGGVPRTGGIAASGGTLSTGGFPGTGGTPDTCPVGPTLTGATPHSGNSQGAAASLNWYLWSTYGTGSLTTYDTPAFSAAWNNSGDFLARLGLKWDDTKTYDQLGTITAQFAETKTGAPPRYSYIGVYGWSLNPCVEYYIVEDSFDAMPVRPSGVASKGTVNIDGGTYTLYSAAMTGTGSACSGASAWTQFWSVRQTARQCGQISLSQHFKAWNDAGMALAARGKCGSDHAAA
jgi:hypothetical protein